MQQHLAPILDAAVLREDLAAMERQIQFNPSDNDLINRYLRYARKVREIEYRENGYVTVRNQASKHAGFESRLRGQVREDCPCF
jgi:hypothetical protein